MKTKLWINILFMTLCNISQASAQDNYYRYKDKEGHTVISNTVPADVSNTGYEVVSPMGHVVETVPPRKSDAEIAADAKLIEQQREAQKQAAIIKQQAEVQAHKDNILLKSFTSVADINRAKEDKLASIAVLENIVQENLGGLQKQLNDAKAAAATYEAKSQPLPATLQKTITESERQIKDGQAFLERKKAEKLEIEAKYKALTEHFLELQASQSKGPEATPTKGQEVAPQVLPTTTEPLATPSQKQ
ncbi:MAG: DUF4124 domain-containing protein [Candidatus Berkiella sp.]